MSEDKFDMPSLASDLDVPELGDLLSKLPPQKAFEFICDIANTSLLSITLSRHVMAVHNSEFGLPQGELSGIEQVAHIDKVSEKLDPGDGVLARVEEVYNDVIGSLLVPDENAFITTLLKASKYVTVANLNDPNFLEYVVSKDGASPGQHQLLLTDAGLLEVVNSATSIRASDLAKMYRPAPEQFLFTTGHLGGLGNINLYTDNFRYDTLRILWPENLLAIAVGPRSETGVVDHKPIKVSWQEDTAILTRSVNYYDFFTEGECISFWQG